ncbi:hypothetical protein [Peribacillus simplex]|uniref:hypothetical protein n=1 Tax=Peribacillus TaxID=2675229 RepID=UPI0036D7CADB
MYELSISYYKKIIPYFLLQQSLRKQPSLTRPSHMAILILKSAYTIDNVQIAKGERCVVTDIIGYKYEVNFKDFNIKTIIFNNEIPVYFDIEIAGVRDWINEDKKLVKEVNPTKINLKKDLVIKNVITSRKEKSFMLFLTPAMMIRNFGIYMTVQLMKGY